MKLHVLFAVWHVVLIVVLCLVGLIIGAFIVRVFLPNRWARVKRATIRYGNVSVNETHSSESNKETNMADV